MDFEWLNVLENSPDLWRLAVTVIESDLLAALKELQEASLAMTSGKPHTANELERFHQAIEWSKRVIKLAERET
jgi:hypothetical protein